MNKKDQKLLLSLARNAIISIFNDTDPDISQVGHLTQLKGSFVTLHKHGQLRGCIGFPKPIMPLYEQIIASSKGAAFDDPRFTPLAKNELKDIVIEISLLSRPELIKGNSPEEYIKNISIGSDGLIISGASSALLLPQVAVEYNLDAEKFLESVSEKAGLSKDSWKNPENKIYKFKAEIFSEDVA
ncbi:MAG TPA: AmmeMemoRadiSam system protein A [Alphaproteobacteria bacterium]|nr:AmmeMemoRadiSam system protein A [Alphaproteobacteria bacterium]